MRIGYIGLGDQGGPIAGRVAESGYDISVWARRDAALEPFRAGPARIASSIEDVATDVDVLQICVLDGPAVWEVLFGPGGAAAVMKPGSVIICHSTIAYTEAREFAEAAAKLEIGYLDAPVSGGGHMAAAGQLLTMVGGEPATFERCQALLSSFSRSVVYLGPVGTGQIAKLLNNAMLTAHLGIAADAFALATALDLDLDGLGQIVSSASGRSFGAEMMAGAKSLTPLAATSVRSLLTKDVRLLQGLIDSMPAGMGLRPDGSSLLGYVSGLTVDKMAEIHGAEA